MNELALLDDMEQMAVEAAAKIMSGADELAIAVHRIFSKRLYLYRVDERGLPLYNTQKEYEPDLLRKLGISRATLYNHYTPIKIACGPTFDLSYEEFVETGGKRLWGALLPQLEYDRNSGQVGKLANIDLPPGKNVGDYVLEQVRDLAPSATVPELNLTPSELHMEISDRFSRGAVEPIRWEMEDDYTRYFFGIETGYMHEGAPPEVLSLYKKRLQIQ